MAQEGDSLYRAFGDTTSLNSVSVEGNRAVVDLALGDAGTTSTQTMAMWRDLRAIAFQFDEIELMEPRHQGSCAEFAGRVEAGTACLVARPGGGYDWG